MNGVHENMYLKAGRGVPCSGSARLMASSFRALF